LTLKNTGERFLPWSEVDETHFEHIHRYFFAKKFVKGKKVLDLGCGEGYGVNILAKEAKSIVGVEIDKNTIRHAKQKYRSKNIKFIYGTISEIPIQEEHLFDVIVCFETIEHVRAQKNVLKEVKRLLKKNGIFIASTPNKKIYSEEEKQRNPFHKKELTISEFQHLLKSFFSYIELYGQRASTSSNIWPLSLKNLKNFQEIMIERSKDNYLSFKPEKKRSKYLIAIAASRKPKSIKFGPSLLLDSGKMKTYSSRLESDLRKKNLHITKLEKEIQEKNSEIFTNRKFLFSLEKDIKRRNNELTVSTNHISKLQQEIKNKEHELTSSKDHISKLTKELHDKETEISHSKDYISKLPKDLHDKEAEISQSKNSIEKLTQDLKDKETEISHSKDYISKLTKELHDKEAELTKAKEFASKLDGDISMKNDQIKNLENQLKEFEENLKIIQEKNPKYYSSRL